MLEGRVRIPLTALCLSCRCDLRAAAARRLDLRSASDARGTNAAYAAHENTRMNDALKRSLYTITINRAIFLQKTREPF